MAYRQSGAYIIINRNPHPSGRAINGFVCLHSLHLVPLMRKMVSFRSQRFFSLPEARRKLLVPPRHLLHVSWLQRVLILSDN